MSEAHIAIPRPAARVVVLDPDRRILLFRTKDEEKQFWITPGGGLESDETHEMAAIRELWEETGLAVEAGALRRIWVRSHVFEFQGRLIDQQEHFFMLAVSGSPEVTYQNWEIEERTYLLDHRWWSMEEIAASNEVFAPRRLGFLLGELLRN